MEEATKDLAARGLPVKAFKSPEPVAEKIRWLTCRMATHKGKTENCAPHEG